MSEEQKPDVSHKPSFCQVCPLYHAPGPVYGYGPANARIMGVGEAPGEDEAGAHVGAPCSGRPFTGGAGRLLSVLLAKSGIRRESIFLTNAVKCRPPGNRKPTGEEINCCSKILVTELQDVNPNIVVALGDTALNALTYKVGIFKWRGIPLPGIEGKKVLATLHPAHVARSPSAFAYPIFDLQRASGEAAYPEIRRVQTDYVRDGTVADLERVHTEASALGYIGYDIETAMTLNPEDGPPVCNGLGSIPGRSVCFRWTPHLIERMKPIFVDPNIEKVGQNSDQFDQPYLEYHGMVFQGRVADTLQMFHLVCPDMKKDLETINSFYTDIEPWKHEKKGDLFLYNCKDVDATVRSYLAMKKELQSINLLDFYYNHVCPVQPVIRKMTARGIRKDMDKAIVWGYAMRSAADKMEGVLREAFGDPSLNVNSPQQLMKILYDQLGLPIQYKKRANGSYTPSTDEESLEKLQDIVATKPGLQHVRGTFNQIMEIRGYRKADSTFISVQTDERDFVHPRFSTSKAANGRFNSFEPNAQNVPRDLREIYIPDTPEHVFWSCDWSQIERRLAFILSADKVGLELLKSGIDMHTGTAAEALGKKVADVTKHERDEAKFVVYGSDYGRQAESLAVDAAKTARYAGVPFVEVVAAQQAFLNKLAVTFKTFWEWRERNVRFVQRNGYLANPWGRRRWWFSRQMTEVFNFPQSSTAADMMYETLVQVENELPAGSTVRLTVHDELVGICPKDLARQTKECVDTIMNRTWPQIVDASANPEMVKMYYPQGWSCPAETVFGYNWKEAKEGNPQLMKELLG